MSIQNKIRGLLFGAICIAAASAAVTVLLLTACGRETAPKPQKSALTVGKDISLGDITDFYYTYDSSANPPEYQRYRFFVEDGVCRFYHETRGGDHWPLTEADVTLSGTKDLSQEEWSAFLKTVSGGTVMKRQEPTDTGDAGPLLFLYWNGDGGEYQAFSFESYGNQTAFEALCAELKNATAAH